MPGVTRLFPQLSDAPCPSKFFSCNTYGPTTQVLQTKDLRQTYAPAKPFRYNTYKKPGVGHSSHFGTGRDSGAQSLWEGRIALRARPKTREAHSVQGTASNSAKYEYATGTKSRVSSKHSACPPIIVTAIDARCSEPAPMPIATGISPAMMENVVIRIGRRRTRFASTIASCTGIPSARNRLV